MWYQSSVTTDINLFIVSVSLGVIMSLFYCWWYVNTYSINAIHTTYLQTTVSSFPMMRLVTACLLVYYIHINRTSNESTEYGLMSIYLEILMQTLIFVYKAFFWFIICLIASGWQLYRTWLSSRELRRFVFFYMLIFLLICLDQILDILFVNEIYMVSIITLLSLLSAI